VIWFIVGLFVGGTVGMLAMGACAAGAHSDLASEIWELRSQLRSERDSGDAA
jgi:hypothetical protein